MASSEPGWCFKGCSEGPWLQEVTSESMSVGGSREKPPGAGGALGWGAGRGAQASLWTRLEPLRLHMVSCVSNCGADDADTEAVSPPPGACTQGHGNRRCAENTEAPPSLSLAGIMVSEGAPPPGTRVSRVRGESGVLQGMNQPGLAQACPPPPETRKVTIWFRLNHFTDKSQGGAGWGGWWG